MPSMALSDLVNAQAIERGTHQRKVRVLPSSRFPAIFRGYSIFCRHPTCYRVLIEMKIGVEVRWVLYLDSLPRRNTYRITTREPTLPGMVWGFWQLRQLPQSNIVIPLSKSTSALCLQFYKREQLSMYPP